MPQILFAFEFECERPNELCMAEFPFRCSEIFMPFIFKTVEWQFGWTFKIKNIYIIECEWPNGNSNDFYY